MRGMALGERHEGCLHRLIVRVPVVDALCPHVLREHARVGNKAGDGDTNMIVNLEDLLLVGRELAARALQRRHDRVFIRSKPDRCAALLHCLESVLNLVDAPGWRPGGAIGVVLIAEHGACVAWQAGVRSFTRVGYLGTRGGGGGGVPRPTRRRPHACRRGAVRSIPPPLTGRCLAVWSSPHASYSSCIWDLPTFPPDATSTTTSLTRAHNRNADEGDAWWGHAGGFSCTRKIATAAGRSLVVQWSLISW